MLIALDPPYFTACLSAPGIRFVMMFDARVARDPAELDLAAPRSKGVNERSDVRDRVLPRAVP